MRSLRTFVWSGLVVVCWSLPGFSQEVGDRYFLERAGRDIPGHPAPGDHSVSALLPHGATATIRAKDEGTGWLEVDVEGTRAWIIKKYLGQKLGAGTGETHTACVVGAWNLEWLHADKERGFPENTHGGPTHGPRTDADYAAIAELIMNELHPAVLVLEEINAEVIAGDEETDVRSRELDQLLAYLGPHYRYLITKTGDQQHVAMLLDTTLVRLNAFTEIDIPEQIVQDGDIFPRDPLVAYVSALSGGQPQNDFVVVGLHLKSGQDLTRNHDQAMKVLQQKLARLHQIDAAFPAREDDIVLAGDLNLDLFDGKREAEFGRMEQGRWDILADSTYPATRLAGVPLAPRSRIDYLIVTAAMHGPDQEIAAGQATVRQDLAGGRYDDFRRHFSDHFPVTVEIRVMPDDD